MVEAFKKNPDILESVQKIDNVRIVNKPLISEEIHQNVLEIHDQPVVKKIQHEPITRTLRETEKVEEFGKDDAWSARSKEMSGLASPDWKTKMSESSNVKVFDEKPIVHSEKFVDTEVVNRKLVTEIHEQPIIEIHEQPIKKMIYEKPIVREIVEKTVYETESSPAWKESELDEKFRQSSTFIPPTTQTMDNVDPLLGPPRQTGFISAATHLISDTVENIKDGLFSKGDSEKKL